MRSMVEGARAKWFVRGVRPLHHRCAAVPLPLQERIEDGRQIFRAVAGG